MNRSACGLLVALAAFLVVGSGLAGSPSEGTSERAPHPEPRVIVNVLSVRGPHDAAQIQRSARFGWTRFVRCYKSKGKAEPAVVNLGLLVSGEGSVRRAWSAGESSRHLELASCIAEALPGLAMPKAAADSTAAIEVQLAPGDRPRSGEGTSGGSNSRDHAPIPSVLVALRPTVRLLNLLQDASRRVPSCRCMSVWILARSLGLRALELDAQRESCDNTGTEST